MKLAVTIFVVFLTLCCFSQTKRIINIQNQLESRIIDHPGLEDQIEASVSGVKLGEYIRLLGIEHGLNLSVSEEIKGEVMNNFSDARVLDVLVYLCEEYDIEIIFLGNIFTFRPYVPPLEPPTVAPYMPPDVNYDSLTRFVSLNIKRDSLLAVARELTKKTPMNVIIGEGLEGEEISVFIQNRPLEDAVEKLCYSNGLVFRSEEDFFLIDQGDRNESLSQDYKEDQTPILPLRLPEGELLLNIDKENELVTASCDNVDVAYLIDQVSKRLGMNYFIYSRPEKTVSVLIENATYNDFLSYLFHGTDFSFIVQNGVYLIGSKQKDDIQTTEMVLLNYRTIENVIGSFGSSRQANNNQSTNNQFGGAAARSNGFQGQNPFQNQSLSIVPFPELNSFIVSGNFPEVYRFKEFIKSVDQVVPVVMIEVLIVDVNKNHTVSTGINAGIGQNSGQTSGTITGNENTSGLNVNLSTGDINNLINSFNGFGVVNLGNVSPDFYLNIQALETNGVLRTRSTPKLATLNSYTASLSIGQEEYYLETSSVVTPGTNSTVVTEQQNWIPLSADLSIDITPIVSGEGQVTLEITVVQSDFTARSGENGPFGSVNREFSSSLRVMDGEMILLGGLEDKSVSKSGDGLPGIARVPILRWFFGKNTRSKQETKLNIFIRPTIIY